MNFAFDNENVGQIISSLTIDSSYSIPVVSRGIPSRRSLARALSMSVPISLVSDGTIEVLADDTLLLPLLGAETTWNGSEVNAGSTLLGRCLLG